MEDCFTHLAYLGPGGPEFLLVMLILLVMFGAKDAPRILRKLNEIINQVRNTADGFKREVMYGDLNAEHETYEAADVEEEDYSYYDEEVCQSEDGEYPDDDEPVKDSAPVDAAASAEEKEAVTDSTDEAAGGEDDDRKV